MMKTCPTCKGKKEQTIKVVTVGVKDSDDSFKMKCSDCNGTGVVNKEQSELIDFRNNMWCECEDDHGVVFYDDGVHPEIEKHHYRCKKCNKVTQLG